MGDSSDPPRKGCSHQLEAEVGGSTYPEDQSIALFRHRLPSGWHRSNFGWHRSNFGWNRSNCGWHCGWHRSICGWHCGWHRSNFGWFRSNFGNLHEARILHTSALQCFATRSKWSTGRIGQIYGRTPSIPPQICTGPAVNFLGELGGGLQVCVKFGPVPQVQQRRAQESWPRSVRD